VAGEHRGLICDWFSVGCGAGGGREEGERRCSGFGPRRRACSGEGGGEVVQGAGGGKSGLGGEARRGGGFTALVAAGEVRERGTGGGRAAFVAAGEEREGARSGLGEGIAAHWATG
jgi:hypothetical protein